MILWLLLMILVLCILLFWYRRRNLYRLAAKILLYEDSLPIIGSAHKLIGDAEYIMSQLQKSSYSSMKHDGIIAAWVFHNLFFVIVNPMDMEYCLKVCLEKGALLKFFEDLLGKNSLVVAPVPIWKPQRKAVALVFSSRILDRFINVFVAQSQTLVNSLSSNTNEEKIDMWPFLTAYTLASTTENTLGVKLNVQNNQDSAFVIAISKLSNLVMYRLFRPWLQPNWLFKFFPVYKDWVKYLNSGYDFIDEMIKTKKEEMENKKVSETQVVHDSDLASYNKITSLLERLIASSDGTNGYTNIELREIVGTLVVAGTDTTATAIGYTMLLLAKYPEIQKKVYQELYAVFGHSNRLVVKDDLTKLRYMDCVLKESMRLFPPIPFTLRKVDEDTKLPSGVVLPAESNVLCSIWGLHRDPKYWGPDAEHFNPDRFLPDRLNLKHACSFIPFSHGPRNCIGYRYAMLSMKIALSTILREYKIVDDRENGPVPQIKTSIYIMLKPVEGFHVALEKRKQVLT